jgi:hypothetical protein
MKSLIFFDDEEGKLAGETFVYKTAERKDSLVGKVGLAPTKPGGGRFTVSCNSYYTTYP